MNVIYICTIPPGGEENKSASVMAAKLSTELQKVSGNHRWDEPVGLCYINHSKQLGFCSGSKTFKCA